MASLIKRTTTSATSSFLTNLIHHHPKSRSSTFISPLISSTTTRSMGSQIFIRPKEGQALTVEGPTRFYTLNNPMVHPFQTAGELDAMRVNDVVIRGSTFKLIRAAMPGVEEKGCRYWIKDDNVVHFEGTAEDEHQGEEPRKYAGGVDLSPEVISGKISSYMKGGILFLYVPLTCLQGGGQKKH